MMSNSLQDFDIADARISVLLAPVSDGTAMSFSTLSRRAMVLLELETQAGLVGMGESWVNFPEWAPVERVATLTRGVLPLLIGKDSRKIQPLHDQMVNSLEPIGRQWGAPGPIMQAISAADIALWDIFAKTENKSVSELIGSRYRDSIEVYASSLGPTGVEAQGRLCRSLSYKSIKVKLGFGDTRDESTLATAREICGLDTTLYADANQGWSLSQALEMAPLLHKYNVAWIEEPIRGNKLKDLETFYSAADIPVATGENLYSYEEFVPYIYSPAVKIIQPDLTKAGGFTEVLSICKLAETEEKIVIPHFYGGAVGFAATLQLAASSRSITSIEYDIRENPLRDSLIINPPTPKNGFISIPTGPGLGINLDPEAISQYQIDRK